MTTTHSFYIPVMGTGFTTDSPIKVARYGIDSVVSLVDDELIEKLREYICGQHQLEYVPILHKAFDSRARRITAYLNLLKRIVDIQVRNLKETPFCEHSEITKYFELLEDSSALKQDYLRMLQLEDFKDKIRLQDQLRKKVTAGSIDVNIMTKLDRNTYKRGEKLPKEFSDAMAAVRGFAQSDLSASVVLSAGLNPHLFTYISSFNDFYYSVCGTSKPKKSIILKVTDYRSALTQGKIFAKKGIWVTEYRIESGLNCGGHAFSGSGTLMGPVLETFKQKRKEFTELMFENYRKALAADGRTCPVERPTLKITAQGGIGTHHEHEFLIRYYELSGVGWGSPFLLVPEATTVDDHTLEKLVKAGEDDIRLSHSSPLGVPFYTLKDSASEQERLRRIQMGAPGSPCLNQNAALFNTEFSKIPLCVSSRTYQEKKINQLKEQNLEKDEFEREYQKVVAKACICRDLGDGAMLKYGVSETRKKLTPAICPGPNLMFYSKISSLREMVDHIYGRGTVLSDPDRPNVFINELKISIKYLKSLISEALPNTTLKQSKSFEEFGRNLAEGIAYYRTLASQFHEETVQYRDQFLSELQHLHEELEALVFVNSSASPA